MRRIGTIRTGGYTLVEVLTVVTILGVAGAIVVPQMLAAGTMHVQAATRIVIADLLYAQNEAISRQSVRRVVFEPGLNRYRITDGSGTTLFVSWKSGVPGAANYLVDFDDDSRFRGVQMENVGFDGQTTIEFDDLGTPTLASRGSLDLVSGQTRLRIWVEPVTGKVSVEAVNAQRGG